MSRLKLVTLPIGNLKDITRRAIAELDQGSIIFCEDTKSFRKLMSLLEISLEGKLIESFHDHSQVEKIGRVINFLNQKRDVVFVSEAGSPIISDPAFPLIQAVTQETDHFVESIPGACSVIAALEMSGLPANPFHFYGFLPRDKNAITSFFNNCFVTQGTHIFFESPNRIRKTIDLLSLAMPTNMQISICREITKMHEDCYRFSRDQWSEVSENIKYLGECVFMFYVSRDDVEKPLDIKNIKELAEKVMAKPGHQKTLAKLLSKLLEKKTDEIYRDLIS